MNPRLLAVIPARGGSKRIPHKNIRALYGKPLIAYTIDAALKSNLFARVVISTDSPEIAEIAQTYGGEIPFLRAAELANDTAPVSLATLDMLERLDAETEPFDAVAQLMPNCPFRTDADIVDSYQEFQKTGAQAQISVTRFGWQNPWWALRRDEQKHIKPFFEKEYHTRSQDLPELFCPTGALWWANANALRAAKTFYTGQETGWEIAWQHGLDIDTMADWNMAEALFSSILGEHKRVQDEQ